MNNKEIARVFEDIADLLELKGENPFKIRAYQKVVRSIEQLPEEMEQLVREDRLREVPGVGEAIKEKITELVTTGKLDYYEKLKAEFPKGITALLEVPGIGPKTARLLSTELGITSVDELEAAIVGGKVAQLYRMGDKTAENILHQIQAMRRKDRRIPIGEALPLVDEIFTHLKDVPGVKNLTTAGSLRRFRETVGDIDLMGTADNPAEVIRAFTTLPMVKEILGSGSTKSSVVVTSRLQVDLRLVEHDSFGSLLQYFTGSKEHNINLRDRMHRRGLKLSEYGITDLSTEKLEKFATEEAFYQRLGMQYIPPEIRENTNEIERAEQGTIPDLIEIADIRGDLHVHSDWSDGRDSMEAMALAAKALGYTYLAIADHSAGRGIAHGLDARRLKQQIAEIKELNRKISGLRIFSSAEVDIRADGSLDMTDEMLKELDIVTAAVHSGLNQSQEQMTRRIIKALENPNVDILAHPTCRMLPGREPVAVDMEAVFQAALKTNTILELNAMPSRLDLKDTHTFRARELGVKIVIDTDAHSVEHLGFIRFGIGVARRGWCEAKDILNTRPLGELIAYLKSRG
ncbi:MAG: DNA polymerase/3'-5' exonuclease PolX [Dehalococcoidales bacterium]|nr:DNA polymerase/3'-5' exonuclease PolX [Dehalococcoidales bacterium]